LYNISMVTDRPTRVVVFVVFARVGRE